MMATAASLPRRMTGLRRQHWRRAATCRVEPLPDQTGQADTDVERIESEFGSDVLGRVMRVGETVRSVQALAPRVEHNGLPAPAS